MAKINFPDPSTTNPWYNPANGITYVYADGTWSAVNAANADEVYVEVSGDNMDGDLTLGTDKITLYATNGKAEFAAGTTEINEYGTLISNSSSDADDDSHMVVLGQQQGVNKFALYARGDASFDGALTIGEGFQPTEAEKSGSSIFAAFNAQHSSILPGTTAVFQSYWGTSATALITAEGSASFNGVVTSQGNVVARSFSVRVFNAYDYAGASFSVGDIIWNNIGGNWWKMATFVVTGSDGLSQGAFHGVLSNNNGTSRASEIFNTGGISIDVNTGIMTFPAGIGSGSWYNTQLTVIVTNG